MENKNNKSLKTKLSNAFNGAKETIKNTGEAIKQGAEKIGTGLTKTAAGIVIGAALLTGATITTGCAQINNPHMPEIPEDPIEAPYEEEQTEQTPNIETEQENPSIDIPSVEPTPDEPEQEQEQEQKLPDINNGEPHDKSTDTYEVTFREYHSDPYSRIYNSGFTIHNFFGEKPDMDQELTTTAEYAVDGVNYLYRQLDNLEKSLEGRPAAQHYFDEFITRSKGEIVTLAKKYQSPSTVDFSILSDAMNAIITNGMHIIHDIVEALPDKQSIELFDIVFAFEHLGSYRFGAGKNFLTSPKMLDSYYISKNEIHNFMETNYPEYANDFRQSDLLNFTSYQIAGAIGHAGAIGYFSNGTIELPEGVTPEDRMAIVSMLANAGSIQGGYESLIENGYDIGNAKAIINPAEELHHYINDKYLQNDAEQDLQK